MLNTFKKSIDDPEIRRNIKGRIDSLPIKILLRISLILLEKRLIKETMAINENLCDIIRFN